MRILPVLLGFPVAAAANCDLSALSPLAGASALIASPCGQSAGPGARKALPPGYESVPIASAEVVNAKPATSSSADPKPSATCASATSRARLGPGEMMVSGSFTADYVNPVVDVLRDGERDNTGSEKTRRRGGVAILEDGSVVVCQQDGSSMKAIQSACSRGGKRVVDFLGGGALLVKDGRKACGNELYDEQQFTNGARNRDGLTAQQMRRTDHVVVAMKDGIPHVVIARNKTGAEIQRDLAAAGFDQVVKLDGGSGYFACDRSGARGAVGSNPMGLRIRKR